MPIRTDQIPQEAALFRARLRHIREKRFKLSHELFAREVEVSSKSIFDWEKGPAMPGIPSLIKLARVSGVSTDYLLGLTNDPAPASGAGSSRNGRDAAREDSGASHAARKGGAGGPAQQKRRARRRPS